MNERIEGVPVGARLVRIGLASVGADWIIDENGKPKLMTSIGAHSYWPIIVPNNVYNVIDLTTVPIPEGEEYVEGLDVAFHGIVAGSRFIADDSGKVMVADEYLIAEMSSRRKDLRRIHVRKIQPKTRRVLIREYRISDDGDTCSWSNAEADRAVAECPGYYRIEERPL